MRIFHENLKITLLILALLPFFGLSQQFFDDIYYDDNEVDYDFLDEVFYEEEEEEEEEEYFYDEDFTYEDRITRFQNNSFDY